MTMWLKELFHEFVFKLWWWLFLPNKIYVLLLDHHVTEDKFVVWNFCFSGPTSLYLFEFSNTNSRTKCKICLKLKIEVADVVLVSFLLTLNIFDMLTGLMCFLMTLSMYMVAAPPSPNFRGDLKISGQNNWGGPEQKIKFGGDLKF